MPIDQVGDIVRVTIAFSYPDGQVVENNVAYRCTAAGVADSRGALGNAVYAFFVANYLGHVSSGASIYGYKVASLNKVPTPSPAIGVIIAPGGAGAIGCPTQARPLLKLKTDLAGRKYRGRLFLPPPSAADITTTGFPSASLNIDTGLLGTALTNPVIVAGSTWVPGIAHVTPHTPLATSTTPITAGVAAGKFGTQRRSGNTGRVNIAPW